MKKRVHFPSPEEKIAQVIRLIVEVEDHLATYPNASMVLEELKRLR
jgi:hypothetical protein